MFQRNHPTESPWGAVQQATAHGAGIWFVSTASHGGFLVSQDLTLPEPYGSFKTFAGGKAFEEDADAVLVVLAFPERFTWNEVKQAAEFASSVYGRKYFGQAIAEAAVALVRGVAA